MEVYQPCIHYMDARQTGVERILKRAAGGYNAAYVSYVMSRKLIVHGGIKGRVAGPMKPTKIAVHSNL